MRRIIIPDLQTHLTDQSFEQEEEVKEKSIKLQKHQKIFEKEENFKEVLEIYKTEILEANQWFELNDLIKYFLENFEEINKNFENISVEFLSDSFLVIIENHLEYIDEMNHLKIKNFQDFIEFLKKSEIFNISKDLEMKIKDFVLKRTEIIKENFFRQCEKTRKLRIKKRKKKVKDRTKNFYNLIKKQI